MSWKHRVTALLLSIAFAGCFGGDTPEAEDQTIEEGPEDTEVPRNLQYDPGFLDDEGGFVTDADAGYKCREAAGTMVAVDANQSFKGAAHVHDQWGGQDEKVIFDADVEEFVSGNWFETPEAVVIPGAGRAEFRLDWDQIVDGDGRRLGVDLPNLDLNASEPHVDHVLDFEKPGDTHTIDFTYEQNDPAHATKTLWSFKMAPHNPATQAAEGDTLLMIAARTLSDAADMQKAHLTWTLFRTYDCLPVDPPHYEFWEDRDSMVLFEATTEHEYTATPTSSVGYWRGFGTLPDNATIPPGTGTVRVTMTWQNDEPVPVPLGLEYVTAAEDAGSTTTTWKRPVPTEESADSRTYDLAIHPSETDSPYANKSDWDFRFYFDGLGHEEVDDIGRFIGTIDWKVEALRAQANG